MYNKLPDTQNDCAGTNPTKLIYISVAITVIAAILYLIMTVMGPQKAIKKMGKVLHPDRPKIVQANYFDHHVYYTHNKFFKISAMEITCNSEGRFSLENNTNSPLYNVYGVVDILDKDQNVIQTATSSQVETMESTQKMKFKIEITRPGAAILRVRSVKYSENFIPLVVGG